MSIFCIINANLAHPRCKRGRGGEQTVLRFSALGGMDVLISGPLGPGTKDPHYSNRMHPPANGIAIYRGSRVPKFTISVEVAEKLIKYMRK